MNVKGVPDTIQIDPLGTYSITVHTLPPVYKDSVAITPGKHNIIGIDAPQGDLRLKIDGSNDYKNLEAIVRKHKDSKTLHVQDFNSGQRYLVGNYDLEILTTPRIYLDNINISQSKTTTIQIPNPGIVTLMSNSPGYGTILLEEDNKLKWVYNLSENSVKESVVLQPGNYRVIFRPKNSQSSLYTIEKTFRIASGSSISVPIN
jgi:Ca-activated chloride channel family protein